MKPVTCVVFCLVCVVLAAVANWAANIPTIDDAVWKGAGQLLSKTSELLSSAAVAFLALTVYAGAKVATEERVRTRERETLQVLSEIRERIAPAKGAIQALVRIQQQGADLFHDGVDPFSDITSFCAGWIQPKRKQWCDQKIRSLLTAANRALFSFMVALEVKREERPANIETLEELGGHAKAALTKVEREICRQTGAPVVEEEESE